MNKVFLPRYFFASVFLLLVLVSVYAFFESRRLRRELMRQAEAKGRALAAAIETGARNAILGNSLLEEQIGQRLLDNARLIDELLFYPAADQDVLKKISAMNHLQKGRASGCPGPAMGAAVSPEDAYGDEDTNARAV